MNRSHTLSSAVVLATLATGIGSINSIRFLFEVGVTTMSVTVVAVGSALYLGIIFLAWKGKTWSQYLLIVLLFMGMPASFRRLVSPSAFGGMVTKLILGIQLILNFAAVVLLQMSVYKTRNAVTNSLSIQTRRSR